MRINKYIAQSGLCSRRKADELIENGNVKVNGAVLKEPGYDVKEGDVVNVNGTDILEQEELVYYLLNKPVGYVTTAKDEQDRATVMDLVSAIGERVFPVGRLDMNTSGALILTNDGKASYRIAHPKERKEREFFLSEELPRILDPATSYSPGPFPAKYHQRVEA